MCTYSMIGDYYRDRVWPQHPYAPSYPVQPITTIIGGISREEFEELRKEVQELAKLVKAAKQFDEAVGCPDCEADEKVKLVQELLDAFGLSVDDLSG